MPFPAGSLEQRPAPDASLILHLSWTRLPVAIARWCHPTRTAFHYSLKLLNQQTLGIADHLAFMAHPPALLE
jgi:hypothetical protein